MAPPLILIGIASNRDWKPAMGMSFASLVTHSTIKGISVAPVCVQQCYLHEARNQLVRHGLRVEADAVLFMDDDLVFPHDALERLVSHGKDIVGPVYGTRNPPHGTLGDPMEHDRKSGTGLMKYIPGGLMLVKTKVFKKLRPPWFKFEWDKQYRTVQNLDGTLGEDVRFCYAAREAGFDVYCDYDLSYEIVHIGESQIQLQRTSH